LRLLILVACEGFLKDKCGPRAKMFEHHWSNGLGPGLDEAGQGGLKVLHLRRHSQKPAPPTKNFTSSAN